MPEQEWRLLLETPDGRLCGLVRGTIPAGGLQAFLLAVHHLNAHLPPLRVAVNEHVVTSVELTAAGCQLRGYRIGGVG